MGRDQVLVMDKISDRGQILAMGRILGKGQILTIPRILGKATSEVRILAMDRVFGKDQILDLVRTMALEQLPTLGRVMDRVQILGMDKLTPGMEVVKDSHRQSREMCKERQLDQWGNKEDKITSGCLR